MDVSKISIGRNIPDDVNVIIEVPMGSEPIKYELDKDSGAIFVDRFLHTAMTYPCNYGLFLTPSRWMATLWMYSSLAVGR